MKVGFKENCSVASQIADQIRWSIVTGELKPGEKLPPVRSLAEQLGVNFHTIRAAYRILEDNQLLATRQGIGSIVLEYSSSDIVKNNTVPTHTIGIIVPDLQNPFYPILINGVSRVANEQNVLVITSDTTEQVKLGNAFFDMLITKRVDGILISPMGDKPQAGDMFDEGEYYDFPIPLVFVDRPNVKGYSVLLDARGAGYKSTQHLVDHGHRKIAVLTGDLKVPTLFQCYEGYLDALDRNGLIFDDRLVVEVEAFTYQQGYDATLKLIRDKMLPSAIFAAGDILAIGALRALKENHIRVPEDVAITGYNDIDVSNFVSPLLTSVTIPARQMGEESARMLLKLVDKIPVEQRCIVMPTELVIRESCGCHSSF
jgi:DNA-binding LacI/PurR family transcriptional regulator